MTHQLNRSEALEMHSLTVFNDFVDRSLADAASEGAAQILKTFGIALELVDKMPGVIQEPQHQILGRVAVLKKAEEWIRKELIATGIAAHEEGASWAAIARAAQIAPSSARTRFDPKNRQKHADDVRQKRQLASNNDSVESTTS